MTTKDFTLPSHSSLHEALVKLNDLAKNAILFVLNQDGKLIGSLTDGDIRRGLIKGLSADDSIDQFYNPNPKKLILGNYSVEEVEKYIAANLKMLPLVNEEGYIIRLVNLQDIKTILPIDTVIMAGGKGVRLLPLTEKTPKPMLKIGAKPILEHNIDRLASFGIYNQNITLNYLGHIISDYFGNGQEKGINIHYIQEKEFLGTFGAVSLIDKFENDTVLIMNSDILTNINFRDFYLTFIESGADMAVATTAYEVNIPYAVLETSGDFVSGFKEKPTYTYYSNAGIYLVKRELLNQIPKNSFYNATDFMENLIEAGKKVLSYKILGYWLDIGKHEDYNKAQSDINHLTF